MLLRDVEILVELQVIVVCLIDLSGAVDEFKNRLKLWLKIKGEVSLKPIDCSLCTYHWTALIVMLRIGRLSLEVYMVICLLAIGTIITRSCIELILNKLLWLLKR